MHPAKCAKVDSASSGSGEKLSCLNREGQTAVEDGAREVPKLGRRKRSAARKLLPKPPTKVLKFAPLNVDAEVRTAMNGRQLKTFTSGGVEYIIPRLFWEDASIFVCIPPVDTCKGDIETENITYPTREKMSSAKVICVKYVPSGTEKIPKQTASEEAVLASSCMKTPPADEDELSWFERDDNDEDEDDDGDGSEWWRWDQKRKSWCSIDLTQFVVEEGSEMEIPRSVGPLWNSRRKVWINKVRYPWRRMHRAYTCKLCITNFTSPRHLYRHLIQEHPKDSAFLSDYLGQEAFVNSPTFRTLLEYVLHEDSEQNDWNCEIDSANDDSSEESTTNSWMKLSSQNSAIMSDDSSEQDSSFVHSHSIDGTVYEDEGIIHYKVNCMESSLLETDKLFPHILGYAKISLQCPNCSLSTNRMRLSQSHSCEMAFTTVLCDGCGIFFARKMFHDHYRHSHLRKDPKRVECNLCGKEVVNNRLERHQRYNCSKGDRVKPFSCATCGKTFSSAFAIRRHEFIHRAKVPFACDLCGRTFTQESNMRHHRRQHTGEKPYKCSHCPEAFTHNVSLKTHLKKYHDIDLWKQGHTGGGRPKKEGKT